MNAFYSITYDEDKGTSDVSEANKSFSERYIKVGSKYYKISFDPDDKVFVGDTCCMNDYIYKIIFTEVGYKYSILSFDGNGNTSGSMDRIQFIGSVSIPSCGFSKDGQKFKEWNTKSDGTGETYLPGQTVTTSSDLLLYAIWIGKSYTILASYSKTSSHDSMNGVEANRIKNMINSNFDSITLLLGSDATSTNILSKINDCINKEDCQYLFIYLFGHGNRVSSSTSSSGQCTYIACYNSTSLRGDDLWKVLSTATCKVFVFIHTCHAGDFFKAISTVPSGEIQPVDEVQQIDLIQEARQYFNNLKKSNNLLMTSTDSSASNSNEPTMLIWTSNKSAEYGWMVNSNEALSDPVWYRQYNMVGSGLGVSFYNNFDKDRTYAQIWSLMNQAGEACLKNPANIVGTVDYGKTEYKDGPTPQKGTFGGFDEDSVIFT